LNYTEEANESFKKRDKGGSMKVCIIGTGDAGAIAALQIRRLSSEAQIDVFSERKELGCNPCEIPLVLGGIVSKWEDLYRGYRIPPFYEKRNIALHLDTEVTDILRHEKRIVADGEKHDYDKAILALGTTPIIPSFPGLDGRNEFALSTDIADGRILGEAIGKHSTAAIIGGGFIALEIADVLKARGYSNVYLLVRRNIMRTHLDEEIAERLKQVLVEKGIELIVPAKIERISSRSGRKRVILSDKELEIDFIFFGTGAEPNVKLAQEVGLEIGDTGAIVVNPYLQTSDPDIYAIGDCMENWDMIISSKRRHQLATNAIRTGYIAGRNAILGNRISYGGTVMPFITRIFDYQVGAVGFTEREAREKGMKTISTTVNTPYLREPREGKPAWYKLIAETKTQTLIGAQLISEEIVSGTIDKLAVAIANRMPLIKLVQIDSCYSPYVQEDQIAVPVQRLIDKLG
jgi:NADPH-dependent 2,4-dienoyl-CoA reductase/sulfur reductase-like enzyme